MPNPFTPQEPPEVLFYEKVANAAIYLGGISYGKLSLSIHVITQSLEFFRYPHQCFFYDRLLYPWCKIPTLLQTAHLCRFTICSGNNKYLLQYAHGPADLDR